MIDSVSMCFRANKMTPMWCKAIKLTTAGMYLSRASNNLADRLLIVFGYCIL